MNPHKQNVIATSKTFSIRIYQFWEESWKFSMDLSWASHKLLTYLSQLFRGPLTNFSSEPLMNLQWVTCKLEPLANLLCEPLKNLSQISWEYHKSLAYISQISCESLTSLLYMSCKSLLKYLMNLSSNKSLDEFLSLTSCESLANISQIFTESLINMSWISWESLKPLVNLSWISQKSLTDTYGTIVEPSWNLTNNFNSDY